MKTVSVIHCFDHNYVLPAAVAFQTLLEHAASDGTVYDLHVLGSGMTDEDRALLKGVVSKFPMARLSFREPPENPIPSEAIPAKGHYSLDLYFKLMVPDVYSELDRAVLADVDVIWEDDVAKVLEAFPEDGRTLVAGAWDPGYAAYHREGLFPTGKPLIKKYARKFSPDELERLRISAGLMVFDMVGLRRAGLVRQWVDFALANWRRAILPEQEPINLVSSERVATLPHRFMADASSSGESGWGELYAAPVMLHYASREKPWKYPGTPLSDRWFAALSRAGLVEQWRRFYAEWSQPLAAFSRVRKLLDFSFALGCRKYRLIMTKDKVGK